MNIWPSTSHIPLHRTNPQNNAVPNSTSLSRKWYTLVLLTKWYQLTYSFLCARLDSSSIKVAWICFPNKIKHEQKIFLAFVRNWKLAERDRRSYQIKFRRRCPGLEPNLGVKVNRVVHRRWLCRRWPCRNRPWVGKHSFLYLSHRFRLHLSSLVMCLNSQLGSFVKLVE